MCLTWPLKGITADINIQKRLEIWWLTQENHADSHGTILDAWHVKHAIYNAFVYVYTQGYLKLIKSTRPIVITLN